MNRVLVKFKELFLTKEFLRYALSGAVATVVNLGVFSLMSTGLGLSKWYLSLLPAIIISILAAYALNRIWVFRSKQPMFHEMLRFLGSRLIISVIFEYAGYYLIYNMIGFRAVIIPGRLTWAKFFAIIFVVIGNYFAGKFFVFTKNSKESNISTDEVSS